MKLLKILALIAGCLALLVIVAAAVVLNSGFQTWAVRKAVASQPGLKLEVESVSAGPFSAEIRGLKVERGGIALAADSITARYSALAYLTGKRISVDEADLTGLEVDLRAGATAAAPAPATPAPTTPRPALPSGGGSGGRPTIAAPVFTLPANESFAGLFTLLRIPVDFSVGRFKAEGRAFLTPEQTVTFLVEGRELAIGASGRLEWKVDLKDASPTAALSTAQVQGNATVRIAADRRIDRFELSTTARADGPGLPDDPLRLDLTAAQASEGGNETYEARLGLVRGADAVPLFRSNVEYQSGTQTFTGTWNVSVGPDQVTALAAGLGLPNFNATGTGKFSFAAASGTLLTDGSLRADVPDLRPLSPALAPVGGIRAQTSFDLRVAREINRLERLELVVTDTQGQPIVDIRALQTISVDAQSQRVSIPNPGDPLARIDIPALPLAWAQPFIAPRTIERGTLSLAFNVEAATDGSRVAVRPIRPVTLRDVVVRNGEIVQVDQGSFSVNPRLDYAGDILDADLTDLTLTTASGERLTGQITARVANLSSRPAVTFTTQLQGRAEGVLAALQPLAPGPLEFSVQASGRAEDTGSELSALTVRTLRANGPVIATITLAQPVRFDTASQALSAANPNAPAARIELGDIPLAWAQPFVEDAVIAGNLTGGTLEVSVRSLQDLAVNTTAPLMLRGVGATLGGAERVRNLDVALDLNAGLREGNVTYDVRSLQLRQGNTAVATVKVAGTAVANAGAGGSPETTVTAKGNVSADLPALLLQPALAPHFTLARGSGTIDFEATLGQSLALKAKAAARDLLAKPDSQTRTALEVDVDIALDPAGSGRINLPLVLSVNDRRTDLTIEGTVARRAEVIAFDGRLTGNQVVIDDLQTISQYLPSSQNPPAPAPAPAPVVRSTGRSTTTAPAPVTRPPAPQADTKPFWQGVSGRFAVDLKRVLYGQDYPITGLRGSFVVNDTQLAVEKIEGRLKENPFTVAGGIAFAPQHAKPYTLAGSASVIDLDIGAIMRATNPNDRPALETQATISAKLGGTGLNLNDLIAQATGNFELTGKPGVLRALGRRGQTVSAASAVVGIVGALRGSDTTVAVAELASALNELSFDQFTLRAERTGTLDLRVTALEFRSPTIRITGSGGITHRDDLPIEGRPLRFDLQLAGKDNFAFLLSRAGVLGTTQDELGYTQMSSLVSLGGTAAKPDASAIWRLIGQAAIGGLLR